MIEITHASSGVPDFVMQNIERIHTACISSGLTLRQLADISDVDLSIITKYKRHEKWPCRSYYNRMAKVLGFEKWEKRRKRE